MASNFNIEFRILSLKFGYLSKNIRQNKLLRLIESSVYFAITTFRERCVLCLFKTNTGVPVLGSS